ncbi:prepilin-type N-terminal cleavage/methylation domain-containing protein [Acidisoma cellulosilytica]|uniref:Prepilin-type N-terminal cleavage/methylation domain-containing protein n=1 Tax=Acidisoma cellulosilyticum TaxID=2802395 RepID=A0A963Z5D9_9PROT|nr:prepilin-type N-terminal cleavage/methylation domain-containing protein [Acidisoma cellulosilyticum]MCB8883159.1 prepilin-type N-terminal cleavage/methylation domain-containing protein [Acidisoma cellulosilyticum]
MIWRRSAEDGFTLLEVLVSLVVLALIILGLAQGLRFGVLALHRQSRVIDQHGDLDAVDRTLRNLIEQINPGNAHDAPQIKGNATSMEFTSVLPYGAAAALTDRQAEVRVLVNSSHQLILRWAPYSHATYIMPPQPTDTTLLQGVERIELSYWSGTGKAGWRSVWDRPDVPAIIRIHIVFLNQGGLHWPDIVAAPSRNRL